MDILSSCTFELEDIEIIDPNTEDEEKLGKWHCDQCSLFFLDRGKLAEHKKKHTGQEVVNCKYCNKKISSVGLSKECYKNRKCETCEYKCSKCPQRFLRRSSLVNHEKKHSSPKKKKTNPNSIIVEEAASPTGIKRKRVEMDEKLNEVKNVMKRSPKKKVSLKVKEQATLDIENTSNKMPKRLSSKDVKSVEDKNYQCSTKTPKQSNIKSNQNTITKHSQIVPLTSNTIKSENVINYKPFSCHMCQGRFASDEALLNHIKTHGENADRSFKCKFCNDEFDDVYKMQYHLAICPLAEDELESTLKQVIPTISPIKYSEEVPSSRKRGRPKKTEVLPDDHDDDEIECTPSSKRGRHRKIEEAPDIHDGGKNESTPSFTRGRTRKNKSDKKEKLGLSTPTLPTKSNKLPQKEFLSEPNSFTENEVEDPLTSDVTETMIESETIDEMKKIHQCPFPRCDFKFTREKALLCHMRNHSDDFEDSLKCHKCDIPFDDVHTLRLHINTCKGIKEEKDDDFGRADSHDSSPSRTSLKTKKDFICVQCGRSYPNVEKLKRHLESCGSKFVCRICKDDFLNQPLLDEHFASFHPPNTAYHCYMCEEDFISELFLKIHQSDEHGQSMNTQSIRESAKKSVQEIVKHTEPPMPQKIVRRNNRLADYDEIKTPVKTDCPVKPTRCKKPLVTRKSARITNIDKHTDFDQVKTPVEPDSPLNRSRCKKPLIPQINVCATNIDQPTDYNHVKTPLNIESPVDSPTKCKKPYIPRKSVRATNIDRPMDYDHVETPMETDSPVMITPNRVSTTPFTFKTGRSNISTRYFRCPVCLFGFDSRSIMRAHLRENHVVANNCTYSCEICEVSLPFAEMLCYHLELHSTNLLSVNRFSKLIAYVKQNRVSEFRSSEVGIKEEKVNEDDVNPGLAPSQVNEIIGIKKGTKAKLKKNIHSVNKVCENKASPQVKESIDTAKLMKDKQTTNIHTASKICSTIIIDTSEGETDDLHQNEIKSENTRRPLRSKARVNYSLKPKGKGSLVRQKVKLEKVSGEETCKITAPKGNNLPIYETTALGSKGFLETFLGKIPEEAAQTNKKARKTLGSRCKKSNKSLHIRTGIMASTEINNEKTININECTKKTNNTEQIKPVEGSNVDVKTVTKTNSLIQGKQLHKESRHDQTKDLFNSSSSSIEYSEANTETERNVKQKTKTNLNKKLKNTTTEPFLVKTRSKNVISNMTVVEANMDKNHNPDSELKTKLVQLEASSPEKNLAEETDLLSEATQEFSQVKTIKVKQSYDSCNLSVYRSKSKTKKEKMSGNPVCKNTSETTGEEMAENQPHKNTSETTKEEVVRNPLCRSASEMIETKIAGSPLSCNTSETKKKEIAGNPPKSTTETLEEEIAGSPLSSNTSETKEKIAGNPLKSTTETLEKELAGSPLSSNTSKTTEKEIAGNPLKSTTETLEEEIAGSPLSSNTSETKEKEIAGNPLKSTTETSEEEIAGSPLSSNTSETKEKETAENPLKSTTETSEEEIAGSSRSGNTSELKEKEIDGNPLKSSTGTTEEELAENTICRNSSQTKGEKIADPPKSSKELDNEDSRASTISTDDASDKICCTMCPESFYNQDELLDHLSSHI